MTQFSIKSVAFNFLLGALVCSTPFENEAWSAERKYPSNKVSNSDTEVTVPQRIQVGGTCGLYALGMVMDYWHSKNLNNPTVLVSDKDLLRKGTGFNFEPTSNERILNYVLASGFTKTGEMFDASTLAKTAIHFGYNAKFYPHVTLAEIYSSLDQKHPVIIGFDVDPMGNPGVFDGTKAHYAVLERYYDSNNVRYFVARHGWGTKKDYFWKADDLYASMNNLKYTYYYSSEANEPPGIHLPVYSLGRVDISESLGDTAIEVVPLDETPLFR